MITVFILYYSALRFKESMESFKKSLVNSKIEFRIVVLNNQNTDPLHRQNISEAMAGLECIVLDCPNFWILSMNHRVAQEYISKSDYFVLSDDDILYPPPINGLTWLDYLHNKAANMPNFGKIGLACLDSDRYNEALESSLSEYDLVDIPVDTTPAIYRKNLFMPNNTLFSPRHMRLIKPNLSNSQSLLFTCRSLSNTSSVLQEKSYLSQKAICFTICSAWLSADNLKRTPFLPKLFYLLFRRVFYAAWLLDALFRILLFYLISCRLKVARYSQ